MSLKSTLRTGLSAAFLAPALIVGLAACDTSTDPGPPTGTFYVFNANPAVQGAQMRLGDQPALFSTPLPFGNFCCSDPSTGRPTLLLNESDTPYEINFSSGTDPAVIASTNLPSHRDSIYFIVLIRDALVADLSDLLIFRNNISAPASDQAKIRIVHTAPAVGAIDVYVTSLDAELSESEPLFASLQYGQVLPHVSITPPTDSVLVRITAAGDNVSAPLLARKYSTRLGGFDYLGVESVNTIFLINSRNSPFLLPIGAFVVGGI